MFESKIRKKFRKLDEQTREKKRDLLKNPHKLKDLLRLKSIFPNYNWDNLIMIMIQKPNSTQLKTNKEWEQDNISIKKNEKPILLVLPMIDPDTNEVLEIYTTAYLFDISQTNKIIEKKEYLPNKKNISLIKEIHKQYYCEYDDIDMSAENFDKILKIYDERTYNNYGI